MKYWIEGILVNAFLVIWALLCLGTLWSEWIGQETLTLTALMYAVALLVPLLGLVDWWLKRF